MSLPMTLTKYDSVPMTSGRRNELLEELASTLADRDRIKRHNEEIAKKAKDIVKARDTRITELTEQLALGTESVGHECVLEYDLMTNTIVVKDATTKSVIEERAMTAKERQELLDSQDSQPEYNGSRGKKR